MIKIKIQKLNFGWSVFPIREDIREKVKNHLSCWNIKSDGTVYFQSLHEIEDTKIFTQRDLKEIENGYSIVKIVDLWMFLHFYGWDTHLLAENGEL